MSAGSNVLFISDLHLSSERPHPLTLFQQFISEIAPDAHALYILGDFFEAWVGDDTLTDPFNRTLVDRLKSLSLLGVKVFFLAGNRDFLVGPAFAQAAGLTLLEDPTEIDLFGVSTLITHGDQFCTDDIEYQEFRKQVRNPTWQKHFLAQPLQQRLDLAVALRERSEHAKADKMPTIMDANEVAICDTLVSHPVSRIIHGHTHRPACHEFCVDNKIIQRWVLPDWYESGGYLTCDERGCRLLSVS